MLVPKEERGERRGNVGPRTHQRIDLLSFHTSALDQLSEPFDHSGSEIVNEVEEMGEGPFGLQPQRTKKERRKVSPSLDAKTKGCRTRRTLSNLFVALSPSKWNLHLCLIGSRRASMG